MTEFCGIICTGTHIPEDEPIKCDYINCAAGMGVAGMGSCFLFGDPRNPNCPKFEDERLYETIEEWACMWEWFADSEPLYSEFTETYIW
jgi:hypothetical protein